jgi:hypothetical protein
LCAFSALAVVGGDLLPPLVQHTSLEAAAARGDALLAGLTAWHWALSALILGVLIAALLGAIRSCRAGALGVWLVGALVLLAGAQLHNLFWPSVFGRVLTTADVLRLAHTLLDTPPLAVAPALARPPGLWGAIGQFHSIAA